MTKLFYKTCISLAVGLLACLMMSPAVAQQEDVPLTVRLSWTPWGAQAAFYLAQSKGWYDDVGLDVTLQSGNGSVSTVNIVGIGGNFDVGHASLAAMMIARSKGLPVRAIAPFFRKGDVGVIVPADSDIKGPADLNGKKVVYTAGSLEAPFIDSFLAAGNLTRDDLQLLSVSAAAKATTYAVGRADAAISSVPFIVAAVAGRRPSRGILFADYGLTLPSFGIFATVNSIETKHDAISRLASVTALAWEYIYNGHIDEAVEAIRAAFPHRQLKTEVLRKQIKIIEQFVKTGAAEPIGEPLASNWEQAVKTLRQADLIGDKLAPTDFYVTGMVRPQKYESLVEDRD